MTGNKNLSLTTLELLLTYVTLYDLGWGTSCRPKWATIFKDTIDTSFIINVNLATLIPTLDIGVKDSSPFQIFSSLRLGEGVWTTLNLVVSNSMMFCSWLALKILLNFKSMIVVNLKLGVRWLFTNACNTDLDIKLRSYKD